MTATQFMALDTVALDGLFEKAHTTNTFVEDPVSPAMIQRVYETIRWAPTAMNIQPLRLTVVDSASARELLVPHLGEANRQKTLEAPLTLIASYDPRWHEHMTHLAPFREGMQEQFEDEEDVRHSMGRMNGLIQVGYLLVGLRAHGLQVGPMNGLDPAGVDSVFHAENGWRTLVAINVGHAPKPDDPTAQRPRAGRLEFADAAQIR
ncbi:malonic semialdehyde reductase [Citricoccus nitrophenolicus]|uniref:malonic semialdehyde reductase n=1 Tax=Citricoccus nitrophenolicus TaxID=863575 RepID=UPI0039B6950B